MIDMTLVIPVMLTVPRSKNAEPLRIDHVCLVIDFRRHVLRETLGQAL